MRDRIWVSFEIAPGGDQQGMYGWLSTRGARECGPGLATLLFEYHSDLIPDLCDAIKNAVHLGPADRIYAIYKDPIDGEATGCFLFGARAHRPDDAFIAHPMTMLQ